MVMDNYYSQDRLQEIWHQITQLHLSYLDSEESPEKLEQRNKLESCIKEYLCLTPHDQKFYFQQTSEVLHRSAKYKKDFSGYKAAVGWNAIGMYAGNLLGQPWRQEYRQIKTYSGFYKHQIDANLVGAEIMFEAMGYKHLGNGIMVLDDPICPDRITHVSLDSLIAYVECQILKTIWEEVGRSYEISWLDVLQFRETHLCSPKQSVHALIYRINERQYHELNNRHQQTQQTANEYYATAQVARYPPPANHSFPPHAHTQNPYVTSHMSAPSSQGPHCIYGPSNNTYCPTSYGPYVRFNMPYHVPIPYAQPMAKPQYHTNGYYCPNNGYTQPCIVPTGQLIELDHGPQNGTYDVPDSAVRSIRPHGSSHHQQVSIKSTPPAVEREEGAGTFESWDYVYRNLESQGYNKDLGERGDLLSPPIDGTKRQRHYIREAKKIKPTDLDDAIHGLTINDKMNRLGNNDKELSVPYDSTQDKRQVPTTKNGIKSKTLQRNQIVNVVVPSQQDINSKSMTLDVRKSNGNGQQQKKTIVTSMTKEAEHVADNNKWECSYCTYINAVPIEICEICGKSKVAVQQTMEIGGSQCPRCTLVNPKDVAVCQACNASLKDSPTYI